MPCMILYNSNGKFFICTFPLQVSLIRGGKLFPKRNVGHILVDLDSLNLAQQHTYTGWFQLSKTPRDTWFIVMSLFSSSCNHQNTLFLTLHQTALHFSCIFFMTRSNRRILYQISWKTIHLGIRSFSSCSSKPRARGSTYYTKSCYIGAHYILS